MERISKYFSASLVKGYKKGSLLLSPGDPVNTAFYLIEGTVHQYFINSKGVLVMVHFYKPTSLFPMMLIFGRKHSHYYFEARTDVIVKEIPAEKVVVFFKDKNNLEVLLELTTRFAKGLIGLSDRLEMMSSLSVTAKIALLFLYLSENHGDGNDQSKDVVELELTHQEIATWLGIQRETVSRHLGQMKKACLITYHNSHFTIPNRKALEDAVRKENGQEFEDEKLYP